MHNHSRLKHSASFTINERARIQYDTTIYVYTIERYYIAPPH